VDPDDGVKLGASFGGGVNLFASNFVSINLEVQDIVTRNNLAGLTGAQRWARTVSSTLGPVRCGPQVCASESTGRPGARFVALDAGSQEAAGRAARGGA
jgi:hypothetical protein